MEVFVQVKSISPLEDGFLRKLEFIALKPKILYYYGKSPGESVKSKAKGEKNNQEKISGQAYVRPKTVAVVGSRKYTKYGEEWAYKIAYELARRGVVIVSGLAYGIDSIAHRAALDACGLTVAVLGTPIDKIYPARHTGLAREIVDHGGMVLSEYPPQEILAKDEKLSRMLNSQLGMRAAFLKRNRLIAGLADLVVVVEGGVKSGSLNTAHHAMEQGVIVYAVPGDVSRSNSLGCNRLLGWGAVAFTEIDELLDELGLKIHKSRESLKQIKEMCSTENEALMVSVMLRGIKMGEEILAQIRRKKDFSVSDFSVTVFNLQMKGLVKPLGNNEWMLCV